MIPILAEVCAKPGALLVTLRAKLSGAVYCNRSCLWRAAGRCPNSQRARSVCVSLGAFFIVLVIREIRPERQRCRTITGTMYTAGDFKILEETSVYT